MINIVVILIKIVDKYLNNFLVFLINSKLGKIE